MSVVSHATERRVPPEHRFLGLDRRTFPLAIVAAAVWAFWALLVPYVDGKISYDDKVQPGDVMQLTGDITLTPAAGWGVLSGLRVDDVVRSGDRRSTIQLSNDGLVFYARAGAFDGTPRQLLRQLASTTRETSRGQDFRVLGEVQTVTARSGDRGVARAWVSHDSSGFLAAFVFGGTGVEIDVIGPPDQLSAHADDITAMVESISGGRS